MKVKNVKKPMSTKTRKFNAEDAAQAAVDTVLDVNVLDENGNPVKESELSQDQIEFCAKVAAKKFKAFSASKRKKFNADEESIDVVLPENVADADIDQIVADAVEEREVAADPDEVVVTVEDEDPMPAEAPVEETVEETVEACGDQEQKEFSAEDLKEVEELEQEVETTVNNIPENEEIEGEQDSNPKDFDGVADIKKFARGSVEAGTANALNAILNQGGVDAYKQKFFAATRRK